MLTPQLKYDVTYEKTDKVLSQPQLYQDTSRLEVLYGSKPFPRLVLDDVMLDSDTSLALNLIDDSRNLAPSSAMLCGSAVVKADASPLYRPVSNDDSRPSPTNADSTPPLYGSLPVDEEQVLYAPDTTDYDLFFFRAPASSPNSRYGK